MTAGELASQFELTWPTMSGHFAVLKEVDLPAWKIHRGISGSYTGEELVRAIKALENTGAIVASIEQARDAETRARDTTLAETRRLQLFALAGAASGRTTQLRSTASVALVNPRRYAVISRWAAFTYMTSDNTTMAPMTQPPVVQVCHVVWRISFIVISGLRSSGE